MHRVQAFAFGWLARCFAEHGLVVAPQPVQQGGRQRVGGCFAYVFGGFRPVSGLQCFEEQIGRILRLPVIAGERFGDQTGVGQRPAAGEADRLVKGDGFAIQNRPVRAGLKL
ncbi:hypothetical protein HMSSN036_83880 [Paenibacillus macerans]|nr:hypothetical protein HMSSN036_83880 [Paenibacillus macerans]